MTAPAAPPTTAPTGPPTTAPVTAPPAAPVKAPLSSARAIVPAPRKVAPARARAESFICELPLSMTPPQNGRRDISFHFGRAVLGVSSRRSAEQIPTEHISAQPMQGACCIRTNTSVVFDCSRARRANSRERAENMTNRPIGFHRRGSARNGSSSPSAQIIVPPPCTPAQQVHISPRRLPCAGLFSRRN